MSILAAKKVFVGLSRGVDSSVSAALLSAKGGSASGGKNERLKVFVGLSGGVDSSVSALLLKHAGYDVTGVFIRVWQPDFFACSWKDDRLDAMRVCAKLHIPFVELDLEKEYKKEVVDHMIREYRAGRTPNPDVMCNRFIKFGGFYEFARKSGADFIATGHYARTRVPLASRKGHPCRLLTGRDVNKDQSYFLWQIRKEQLPHILFPVGDMKKAEVRAMAKKAGLITADKKDSQGLCFIGKVDMKEFLSHYIKPKRGKVLAERDNVIGEHTGAFFYTLGERVALLKRLKLKSGKRFNLNESGPWYVISKDTVKNTLTVSHKSPKGTPDGAVTEVSITDCNWLAEPEAGKTYHARVRYRQPLHEARIYADIRGARINADGHRRESAFQSARIRVRFVQAQNAVAGQSLVLYDGDVLVGGGIIV